ncbi:Bacterial type II secretion system protein F domain protein [Anatilimnocola aggregata]|uniref:Bacterial type II secretion system protein F domain protein n=1 Tax=Anatilimnocola aggregata TaxID=2528021 RepID=A0A517YN43_9BACT|nr:type II secretion system F family protein [Anatilimnocola aggregata]QDU31647.1 Bacterial type II secretion system protein F domain protein [Anatilimnocola aggregata]
MFDVFNPVVVHCLVYFIVTGAFLSAIYFLIDHDGRVRNRLSELRDQERERAEALSKQRGMLRLLIPLVPHVTEVFLPNDEHTRTRLQAKLTRAGIYSTSALSTYFTIKLALMAGPPLVAVALGAVGIAPFWPALLAGGVLGLFGIVLPSVWLARRQAARHGVLRKSLPDFLDLIMACLEGGLSMQAALKQVSEELRTAHPVLASELLMVIREMEIGCTLEQALQHLAERTALDELRTLCTFVSQATKFGTTMADAVAQLAIVLRTQREHRAEEMAQQAAVKILFPTLLFIFPTIFVVLAGPAAIKIRASLSRSGNSAALAENRNP